MNTGTATPLIRSPRFKRTSAIPHADLAALRVALAKDARAFAQSDYAQATLEEIPERPYGGPPRRVVLGSGRWWSPINRKNRCARR